ncbi:Peptide deformylase [hydrothermal vent metagenome]|uniref:Peptide deformylase n=1 Tax=hydrothermal vent metagenome TaxID=652676 RepID=A0A3B0V6Q3_9ZZZZ
MALREVLKYPDPALKVKAASVGEVDAEVRALIADLVETMYREEGLGLAATQVGVARRVIVLDVPDKAIGKDAEVRSVSEIKAERAIEQLKGEGDQAGHARYLLKLVNPEIISAEGEVVFEEGCLSLPGIVADVKRHARILLKALDEEGRPVEIKAGGLMAIALQHEVDHLDGVVFIDRVSRLKRSLLIRKYRRFMASEDEDQ